MSINKCGIASEATWSFPIEANSANELVIVGTNDRPPNAAYKEARDFHAVEYCRLDPDNTPAADLVMTVEEKAAVGIATLARLKQCLVDGYPVIFAFWFYWPKNTTIPWKKPQGGDTAKYESLPDIDPNRRHKGPVDGYHSGHQVLCIAFDEGNKRILCQNSWGEHDEHAYFWAPYHWITDYKATDDFWMLRLLDKPATRELSLRIATPPILPSRPSPPISSLLHHPNFHPPRPLPRLRHANLHRRARTQLCHMFSVGADGSVNTIYRYIDKP